MTLALLTLVVFLGQPTRQGTPAPAAPPPRNCVTQTHPAGRALCEGQEALRGTAKDRAATWMQASVSAWRFRA